jgi:nitrite reductase/ring-hydroxylating ferredoxin subunit
MADENWVEVAKVGDLDDEEAIRVEVNGKPVALYFVEGAYYATDDLCTHEDASLSEGYIDGATIECPLHQGVFCLKTGKALQAPAEKNVSILTVKVMDSLIYIQKLA